MDIFYFYFYFSDQTHKSLISEKNQYVNNRINGTLLCQSGS